MEAWTVSLPSPVVSTPSEESRAPLGELVGRVKANDLTAFEEIYRHTRAEVARALFHLLGNRRDLEALVGETFRVLLREVRAAPAGACAPWPLVYRACARVGLKHLGFFRRRAPEPAADESTRLLHAALARLSPRTRLAFVYAEILGLRLELVARSTGMSVEAVARRLCRARLELTEWLRPVEEAVTGHAEEETP